MASKNKQTGRPTRQAGGSTPGEAAALESTGHGNRARRLALIGLVAVLAIVAGIAWFLVQRPAGRTVPAAGTTAATATYVGSARCTECHAQEAQAWQGSQHQRAMQAPDDESVLGDFADATFTYAGITSTFSRRDGRYVVRTDGPDGQLADFEVRYTFGVYPLQQYLVELPGGRLQALSIAWDSRPRETGGQRWFHLYPDERIDHRDELHWTRRAQNWNYMCADCHSTDVRKGYDPVNDRYQTRFAEISVGCEACHGPGSAHLEWARDRASDPSLGLTVQFDERRGVSWRPDPATGKPRRSTPRTTEREIDVCAQCHARRAQVAEGYRPGRPFGDHYLPSLLTPPLYHPDGQQRDEVYIWGSWLQSRMHGAGVTCSDCHDPHTQKLRVPGNGVCAQCHEPAKYDVQSHHRHVPGQPGTACADCHMPRTTYMVIDPRRDHGMRVPRPDQSVALGVPNACNDCHKDRDARWAANAVRSWYGRDAAGFQQYASIFAAADRRDPAALEGLRRLVFDDAQPAIARASALVRIAGLGGAAPQFVTQAARDGDWRVRLAATSVAEPLPPELRAGAMAPLLADPLRTVRIEAARVLAGAQAHVPAELQPAWQRASAEYVATLQYNADRPESNVALGGFYAALGRGEESRQAFAHALRLDPSFEPAYVNAADALRVLGQEAEATAMLERGLAALPRSAALHHALGLAQARQQQLPAALLSLRQAMALDPQSLRYTYVYAVALHSTGHSAEAIQILRQAVRQWPRERDLLFALASFERDAGDLHGARRTLQSLLEAHPDDPGARALAAELQQQ
ncbi:MAG TPA: tetratricopeptide repeat protein [Steroidobacteraceae bacterium]